jgi:hypothetical protein
LTVELESSNAQHILLKRIIGWSQTNLIHHREDVSSGKTHTRQRLPQLGGLNS